MNIINVRDTSTMTWTDEAIPYDEEMLETQVALWGRENVRVISFEELERYIERSDQERAYQQAVDDDAAPSMIRRESTSPASRDKNVATPSQHSMEETAERTPPPLSIEQLRARRIAFYQPPPAPRRSARLANKTKKKRTNNN